MMPLFRDRMDAGRVLGDQLVHHRGRPEVFVLGLPRGGVPVAYQVAMTLHAPLDVFVVRKLGLPGHRELAMGALASGGVRVFNSQVLELAQVPAEIVDQVAQQEMKELRRRERLYRNGRSMPPLEGLTVIVVDDGLATGATMRAAVEALRRHHAQRVVVAVPVASGEACELLADEADEIVCCATPAPFHGVGCWYADFSQTSDEEVRALLEAAHARFALPHLGPRGVPVEMDEDHKRVE